jgi:hypothetical protein
MHEWINELATQAKGDWLLVWNDDAIMRTESWDHILLSTRVSGWTKCNDIMIIVVPTIGRPRAYEFPLVRRKVVELLGHHSLSPHTDNWVYSVMHSIQCTALHPYIFVEHFSDRIGTKPEKKAKRLIKRQVKP